MGGDGMSNEIVFTISFVKAYEFQELIMGVGEWTPPPMHEIPNKKDRLNENDI